MIFTIICEQKMAEDSSANDYRKDDKKPQTEEL